jgi:acyl carrier protein
MCPWKVRLQEEVRVAPVEQRVIEVIADQLEVSHDRIIRETSIVDDLGADSLDVVELLIELEDEFSINIPDGGAERIHTVGQVIDEIERIVENQSI